MDQSRCARGRMHDGRIEQHQSVRRGGGDAPVLRTRHRHLPEFLAGQAVEYPIDPTRMRHRVEANQPTHARQPDHAISIDGQSVGREFRQSLFAIEAALQDEAIALPPIGLQRAESCEPDRVRIALRKAVHHRAWRATHRLQPTIPGIPRQHPLRTRYPDTAIRPQSDLLDARSRRQSAAPVGAHRFDDMPIAVARLQAIEFSGQPQHALGGFREPRPLAGHRGIGGGLRGPALDVAGYRVETRQALVVADPDLTIAIFVHVHRHVAGTGVGQCVLDVAGFRIEPVERAAAAHQPHVAALGRRDPVHVGVGRRCRIVELPWQHREPVPVGAQVPQSAVAAGKPQAAFPVFVSTRPGRFDRAMGGVAVQRHIADGTFSRCAFAVAAKPIDRIEPVDPAAIAQQHVEQRLAVIRPRRQRECSIGPANAACRSTGRRRHRRSSH